MLIMSRATVGVCILDIQSFTLVSVCIFLWLVSGSSKWEKCDSKTNWREPWKYSEKWMLSMYSVFINQLWFSYQLHYHTKCVFFSEPALLAQLIITKLSVYFQINTHQQQKKSEVWIICIRKISIWRASVALQYSLFP